MKIYESQHHNINKAFDDNIDLILADVYGSSDRARTAVDDLKSLVEAKNAYNASRNDMLARVINISGTLFSIGMICIFELDNVFTSKALSFIPKPKI